MTDRHDLTVPQADALWDAIAIPGPRQATFVEQHERACKTVARLLNERPFQEVQGRCPACRGASLFLGSGGHVTCSRLDCPNPSAADQLLHGEQPAPAPAATQATDDAEHVCKPGASVYYCPTSGTIESDCHGGFDTCCDRPDLHQPKEQSMPACTARIEGPHVIGGGPVHCTREAGHPGNRTGPQTSDGKTLWTDGNAGATPHQASSKGA